MKETIRTIFVLCLLAAIVSAPIILAVAVDRARDRTNIRQEAVERGFAEWQCDSQGHPTFVWKTNGTLAVPSSENVLRPESSSNYIPKAEK